MDKVAFITGASSGLGRGLAQRLAGSGHAVGLAARRVDRLEELAREIRAGGGRAGVYPCDVLERHEVLDAVAASEADLGPTTLLVANAGMEENTRPRALDGARVEHLVRINFLGAVYAAEAVLPGMLQRRHGHLVAMGSLAGYGGLPLTAAYSASKAALDAFFESLRIDLRGTGVDVTILTPGYVKTEMTDANPFPMPFLMELDDALDRMERAIEGRRRRVGFPFPLWIQVFLGQVMPRSIYDRLAAGQTRDKSGR